MAAGGDEGALWPRQKQTWLNADVIGRLVDAILFHAVVFLFVLFFYPSAAPSLVLSD